MRLQQSQPEEGTQTAATLAAPAPASPRTWPDALAYREAIQTPSLVLTDPDLKQGTIRIDRRGLPVAYTGRFAVVFRLSTPDAQWAVRCFTSPEIAADSGGKRRREAHYGALQRYLESLQAKKHPAAAAFVGFRYIPEGIRVGGNGYPLLAMRWAKGQTLLSFVEQHLGEPEVLRAVAGALGRLSADLESAGIAHGDWQHDNLLVENGGATVVLVDYDGVSVPDHKGEPSTPASAERGHPNYQHPMRRSAVPSLSRGGSPDRFSCHVIQTALLALAADPTLMEAFGDGDSLLFKASDFIEPGDSPVFGAIRLIAYSDLNLSTALTALEAACRAEHLADIPPPTICAAESARFVEERSLFARTKTAKWIVTESEAVPIPAVHVSSVSETVNAAPAEAVTTVTLAAPALTMSMSSLYKQAMQRYQTDEAAVLWSARILLPLLYWLFGISHRVDMGGFWIPFLLPVVYMTLLYLWPRNRKDAYFGKVKAQFEKDAEQCQDRSRRLHRQIRQIYDHPENRSLVAYVGAALQRVALIEMNWLRDASPDSLPEVRKDLQLLREAGVTMLSDVTAVPNVNVRPETWERINELRQHKIEMARKEYNEIAERRKALLREVAEVEAERAGIVTADAEMRDALAGVPAFSGLRFVGRILGLRV